MLPGVELPQITHWLKGRTAVEANRLLGRTGEAFWQHESYDHWVRNEREFNRIVAYIEENPVSAGLAARAEDWPWSSATRAS
jgi:REP element-mobilizing transposase RayT